MSRIRVSVSRVDDDNPDVVKELATFDMPDLDIHTLQKESALDDLEASTYEIGTAVLRRVLQARWELVDAQLADQYRQSSPPSHPQSRRTQRR